MSKENGIDTKAMENWKIVSAQFYIALKTGLVNISGEIMYNGFRRKGAYTKLGTVSKKRGKENILSPSEELSISFLWTNRGQIKRN